jgi:prepilin-type N-terminal cleavage/methylation domain-containing protein
MSGPRGVTLIELLVVLALFGIMAGMVGLAWQPGRWQSAETTGTTIAVLRRRAAELGRMVTETTTINGNIVPVIALPDGRIVGASRFGVDPLTGEITDAPR